MTSGNQPHDWGGIPQNQPPVWTGQGPIVEPPIQPAAASPRRRPGLAAPILVTGFFGLFGLIPTIRAARRSRALGFPGKDYWVAFALSMLPALALHSAIVALVVFLIVPQTPVVSGQGDPGRQQQQSQGRLGGDAVVGGCQPEEPLVPGRTAESCGEQILAATTARLFRYAPDSAVPEPDIAESLTTTDNRDFTVRVKQGYRFSDGTEVKAHNFVDAWNQMVARQMPGMFALAAVEGSADPGSTVSGLRVVDDYTFTIRTSEPVADLPSRLGMIQLAPLPDSYFANETAYAAQPVSAGPFRVVSLGPREIVLDKSPQYSGQTPAHLDRVTFRLLADPEAAYQDLRNGGTDVAAAPPSQLGSGRIEIDNAGRVAYPPRGVIATLVMSPTDPQLSNNPKLRRALSMAIDRESAMKSALISGAPAEGWVPPGVPGGGSTACGAGCRFDAEQARRLYAESGGYQGTLALTVNADANHLQWAGTVCASIRATVGADCQVRTEPDFRTFMTKATQGQLPGLFRSGWQMDYPAAGTFLGPLYVTGQGSNWARYANPAFDAKIQQANLARDSAESLRLFAEAEQLLGQDLPTAPLWSTTLPTVWSGRVTQVEFDPWGRVDCARLQRA